MLKEIIFDWDRWNENKNEIKHGVSRLEAESSFYDPNHKLFQDKKHSRGEERFILYGRSLENRILMVAFTLRVEKIRIISARTAAQKERQVYGDQKS